MKILANKHLYRIREFFPSEVEVHLFEPEHFPADAPDYDAMLINTTTAINRETLPDAGNLKIIATGSSGYDHVDTGHLELIGVQFEAASGCNALSVAEYVITAILCHCDENSIPLSELKVGIAGCGHTGQAVAEMLDRFSIQKVVYDPPRQLREPDFKSALFEEFCECNLLTFHTPYTESGKYPTKHLLNSSWFERRKYELVINAARGGVVDESALLHSLDNGNLRAAVIDVWENEPHFNDLIANTARFATPHIAGYSLQSKYRASQMVAEAVCRVAGLQTLTPAPPEPLRLTDRDFKKTTLSDLLAQLHTIKQYDQQFRKITGKSDEDKKEAFYHLRTSQPLRQEFSGLIISQKLAETFTILEQLGCRTE